MDSNGLEFISEVLLDWSSSHRVELGNNPWRCDCALSWLLPKSDSSMRNLSSIVYGEYMTCLSPPRLKGLPMKYVSNTSLEDPCTEEGVITCRMIKILAKI